MKTVDVDMIELFVNKQITHANTAILAIIDEPEDYTDSHGSIWYYQGIKEMCDTMLEFLKEVKNKQ